MWDTSKDEKFYTHVHFTKKNMPEMSKSIFLDISDVRIIELLLAMMYNFKGIYILIFLEGIE